MFDRRTVLAGALALPVAAQAEDSWDATVDPRTGTLGKALEAAAAAGGRPFRILVREGVLVEKLTIAVPNVTIVGSGRGTVLSFGTYAGLKHPDGNNWGTGRTGTWFAYQHSGVKPDVVTLAKGLANGVPIGTCIAAGEAATLFKPGTHGSTFGGNPLACAAALETLSIIEDEGLMRNAV